MIVYLIKVGSVRKNNFAMNNKMNDIAHERDAFDDDYLLFKQLLKWTISHGIKCDLVHRKK